MGIEEILTDSDTVIPIDCIEKDLDVLGTLEQLRFSASFLEQKENAEVSAKYVVGMLDRYKHLGGQGDILETIALKYFPGENTAYVKKRLQKAKIPWIIYHIIQEEMRNRLPKHEKTEQNPTFACFEDGVYGMVASGLIVFVSGALPITNIVRAISWLNKQMNAVTDIEYQGLLRADEQTTFHKVRRVQDSHAITRLDDLLAQKTDADQGRREAIIAALCNRDLTTTLGAFFGVAYLSGNLLESVEPGEKHSSLSVYDLTLRVQNRDSNNISKGLRYITQVTRHTLNAVQIGMYNLVGIFKDGRDLFVADALQQAHYGLTAVKLEAYARETVRLTREAAEARVAEADARREAAEAKGSEADARLAQYLEIADRSRGAHRLFLHDLTNMFTSEIDETMGRWRTFVLRYNHDHDGAPLIFDDVWYRNSESFCRELERFSTSGDSSIADLARHISEEVSRKSVLRKRTNVLMDKGQLPEDIERMTYRTLMEPVTRNVQRQVPTTTITCEYGDFDVYCPPAKVQPALVNLLKNAAEVSEGGSVQVTCSQYEIMPGTYQTELCIVQSGELPPTVVERFNRGEQVATTKEYGHSLGFSTARAFLREALGADITYKTYGPGKGGECSILWISDTTSMPDTQG